MMRFSPLAKAILLVAGLSATALGQGSSVKYGTLLQRIPESTNLLLLADVEALFNSPYGRGQQWREKAAQASGQKLGLTDDITRFVVAAGVELQDAEINWRVGMAQFHGGMPDIQRLAAREGGFVETISRTQVAWTPRGFYLVTFKPDIMGFVAPTTRQAISRWITSTFVKPRTFPPSFADRAIYRADRDSQVVLVLNLDQAIAPPLLETWLASQDYVKKARLDPKLLSETLATVKSAFLQVEVKESIQGTIVVESQFDLNYAKTIGKDLVLSVLDEYGAALDELPTWSGGVEGKTITLSGRMSEESLRRVLSLARLPRLTPPKSSESEELAPVQPAQAAAVASKYDKPDVVRASQAYFRSVADLLAGLKRQKANNASSAKLWYERYAKQIEELPLLGVDKDLLDWGAKVARTLREMAYGVNYSMQDRKYALSTADGGYYGGYAVSNAPQEAIRRQGEATLNVSIDARWQVLNTSVSDMRRMMVDRYKVDF